MIEVKGLDHVVFRTSKIDQMRHFYCEILGCTVERERLAELGLLQLRAGNALIDLVTVDGKLGRLGGPAPSAEGRSVDHVCLQIATTDQQTLIEYLNSHGIRCSEFEPRYGAQGFGPSTYIKDPQGNTIELKPEIDPC